MRIIIERSNFLKSLSHVHRIVERRNTIAILSNVFLKATGSTLEMKTTDLDLEVTETVQASVEHEGQTTVSAHLLHDIVRKFSDGAEIVLSLSDSKNSMSVHSGTAQFQLQCLPETDFPELIVNSFDHVFEISSSALKGLIDKVHFAISTEETRHYLGGIYFHIYKSETNLSKLRSVATDGHRLAQTEIDAPQGAEIIPGVIIPKKTVNELQRLIEGSNTPIKIEISTTKSRFTIENTVLTSRLIDGSFPDYQRVIPKENNKKLIVNRQRFLQAVDRVSTISSEKDRAIRLTLSDDELTLSIRNQDSGSATETLEAEYTCETMETGFNAKYLLDAATQICAETIRFMFADMGSPVLIEDTCDQNTLYVVMPMRI